MGNTTGVITIVNDFKNARYWKRRSDAISPVQQHYAVNPIAKQTQALAQQMMNGRMAGASQLQNNIYAAGANAMGNVNRSATDGSQALAMNAVSQAQVNQGLTDLMGTEAMNRQNMVGNLNQANAQLIQEGDKVHGDAVRRFDDDTRRKDAYISAYQANKTKGIEALDGLIQKIVSMVAGGGAGGAIGGMGGAATAGGMSGFGGGVQSMGSGINVGSILGASGMMQGQTRVPGM